MKVTAEQRKRAAPNLVEMIQAVTEMETVEDIIMSRDALLMIGKLDSMMPDKGKLIINLQVQIIDLAATMLWGDEYTMSLKKHAYNKIVEIFNGEHIV